MGGQSLPLPELSSFCMTSSRLNAAGFCRIGNFLKLASYWPTIACAGTSRNDRCFASAERAGKDPTGEWVPHFDSSPDFFISFAAASLNPRTNFSRSAG